MMSKHPPFPDTYYDPDVLEDCFAYLMDLHADRIRARRQQEEKLQAWRDGDVRV